MPDSGRLRSRPSRWTLWTVERFTDWFTSPAALVQGVIVTLIWLAVVFSGLADTNGWWLLFWFTVFSGTTQFPLAFAARRSSESSQRALAEIDRALDILEAQDKTQSDMLRALIVLLDKSNRPLSVAALEAQAEHKSIDPLMRHRNPGADSNPEETT